jgi:hypothetical protein
MGITAHASFSGALAWPYVYPWPQRPAGLSRPPLTSWPSAGGRSSIMPRICGVDICYEIHPGEDLHDGAPSRCSWSASATMPAATCSTTRRTTCCSARLSRQHRHLQGPDPDVPRQGCRVQSDRPPGRLFSGYQPWVDRAGRFRSLGDGQVDFGAIFSKMAANDFDGWAVVEWECCLKHPKTARAKARSSSADHIIRVTERPSTTSPTAGPTKPPTASMLGIS